MTTSTADRQNQFFCSETFVTGGHAIYVRELTSC